MNGLHTCRDGHTLNDLMNMEYGQCDWCQMTDCHLNMNEPNPEQTTTGTLANVGISFKKENNDTSH